MKTIQYSGLREYVSNILYMHFDKNKINVSNVLRLLLNPDRDLIVEATLAVGLKMRAYAVKEFQLADFPYLTNCMAYQYEENGPYDVRMCLPMGSANEFLNVTLGAIDKQSLKLSMSWPDNSDYDIAKLLTYLVFECNMGTHVIYVDNEFEPVNIRHMAAYAMVLAVNMDSNEFMDFAKDVVNVDDAPNFIGSNGQ